MTRTKLTKFDCLCIINMYNSNTTVKEIADKFNVGIGTIYRVLKDNNIEMRNRKSSVDYSIML